MTHYGDFGSRAGVWHTGPSIAGWMWIARTDAVPHLDLFAWFSAEQTPPSSHGWHSSVLGCMQRRWRANILLLFALTRATDPCCACANSRTFASKTTVHLLSHSVQNKTLHSNPNTIPNSNPQTIVIMDFELTLENIFYVKNKSK